MSIKYRKGYKYQLDEDYQIQTQFTLPTAWKNQFLGLSSDGLLTIKAGYAWDGPSGPTCDTLNFMTPSLVHDALYQLMNERVLDPKLCKEPADQILVDLAEERGMNAFRRWYVLRGVKLGGHPDRPPRPILTAP